MDIQNTDRAKALAALREKEKNQENLVKKDALLCYRVLIRHPEVIEGTVQVLKDTFIKNFLTSASGFDLKNDEQFAQTMHKILSTAARFRITDVQEFCNRVSSSFKKELAYKKDRRNQFSLDVLFQTIDLLSASKAEEQGDPNLAAKEESELSPQERESMLLNFKAYNTLNAKILGQANLKEALLKKDILEDETALVHKELTITSIELMFRNIIAQQLLSRKYKCDTLIAEWGKEYGFEDDMKERVLQYIPLDTPLLKFRAKYAQGVQSIKNQTFSKANVFDSDLFLLRSLANYYTSWIMQVSEMISG
ncbi:MAG: hypothetical protein SH817_16765 [Leptospira sp.]|nr:hypothetical protein [Leptospira sp.]